MTKYVPPVALTAQDVIAGVPTVAKPTEEAPPVPWYLTGGISSSDCVAAYQPIGADDLADSYINLANPGTYNAAPGTAPSWGSTDGWTFDGSTQYLTTGIVPASGWSMIVRYSNIAAGSYAGTLLGTYKANARFELGYNISTTVYYMSGQFVSVNTGTRIVSGVQAVAGQQGYRNGSADGGAIGAWTDSNPPAILIGDRGGASDKLEGKIQAVAIYSATLTSTQVGLLTTAMNAL